MKDPRDYAPGDLVRSVERSAGFPCSILDWPTVDGYRLRYQAVFIPGQLEIWYTNTTTGVWLVVSPSILNGSPSLLEFLKLREPKGVVDSYRQTDDCTSQRFRVMPRFAVDLAAALSGFGVSLLAEVGSPSLVPDSILKEVQLFRPNDFWIDARFHHPALLVPAPCAVLTFGPDCPEFIFTASEIYIATPWPSPETPLTDYAVIPKRGQGLSEAKDGWMSRDGASVRSRPSGAHYQRWTAGPAILASFICWLPLAEVTHQAPKTLH